MPSPRQKVVEVAPVPPFRLPTGRFPVTPPALDEAKLMTGNCDAEAVPEMSEKPGCEAVGMPSVPIAFSHWCSVDALLITPPSVEAVGNGSRVLGNVPEVILPALVVSTVAEAAKVGAPLNEV